jgi:hypothetical protein
MDTMLKFWMSWGSKFENYGDKNYRQKEALFAKQQAEFLEKELDRMEISLMPPKNESVKLTRENLRRVGGNSPTKVGNNFDAISASSFQTAKTGFTNTTTNTMVIDGGKISKEDIIFQKYVYNIRFLLINL